MKERPIIFSGPMVRAIQEGRKSQTRRVVKLQPIAPLSQLVDTPDLWTFTCCDREWRCPYGQSGDLLWVRETWASPKMQKGYVYYRADENDFGLTWKPSIHMPKWATRLWLRITNVWVERLWKITTSDIRTEGIEIIDGWDTDDVIFAKWEECWDSLNAKRGYSWESNPWVWVLEFGSMKEEVL